MRQPFVNTEPTIADILIEIRKVQVQVGMLAQKVAELLAYNNLSPISNNFAALQRGTHRAEPPRPENGSGGADDSWQ